MSNWLTSEITAAFICANRPGRPPNCGSSIELLASMRMITSIGRPAHDCSAVHGRNAVSLKQNPADILAVWGSKLPGGTVRRTLHVGSVVAVFDPATSHCVPVPSTIVPSPRISPTVQSHDGRGPSPQTRSASTRSEINSVSSSSQMVAATQTRLDVAVASRSMYSEYTSHSSIGVHTRLNPNAHGFAS
jgi:hypothetical protein